MLHLVGNFTVKFDLACFSVGEALRFIPDPMPTPALLMKGLHFLDNSTSRQLSTTLKQAAVAVLALPSLAVALSAPAHANLITNGGFVPNSASVGGANSAFLGNTNNTVLTGWKTGAVNTFNPNFWGNVVSDGATISTILDQAQRGISVGFPQGNGTGLNTLFVSSVSSVDNSGWFLAVDGDVRFVNTLSQTINGLVPGRPYELSFYQAAGQYAPYPDQAITGFWDVTFGSSTFQSDTIAVASGAPVSAWQKQTTTFTATNTSQVLSFLSQGTPTGGPPFVLLSAVSLTDTTPVPGPLPVLGVAAAFGASRKLRRRIKLG
jgi:hypothetical protein